MLLEANDLETDNFRNWVFRKEMLFNATGKWWGDFGHRDFPHEGIDLCFYADRSGRICRLDAQTRIPVMHDGVVKALFKDYLGHAVIIAHAAMGDPESRYLSAYAHTVPLDGIRPGVKVRRGDVIATIADTRASKAKIFPHLHFSMGRPSSNLTYADFVWNVMRDPELVVLCDPMSIIDGPYEVVDVKLDRLSDQA